MAKRTWHEGAASIIILPGGEDGEQLLNIVQEWTQCWMLKPAFWVRSDDVTSHEHEQARISATIIARNGRKEIDLLEYLSGVDFSQVRLIALRTVNTESQHDQAQDAIVDVINGVLSQSRPYNSFADSESQNQTELMKINLVFAPSKRKGASFTHLLEAAWHINLVVAPEDRSTPSRFDKSTRDSNDADNDKWQRFLISNTAVAAGIWAGQEKSIFEAASQFTDLSPVQGQVRVMRTFVRGILSEGLSTRVAADALSRSGKAETSKIDGLLPFPNQFLEAYEGERIVEVIDEMLSFFKPSKGFGKSTNLRSSRAQTEIFGPLESFASAFLNPNICETNHPRTSFSICSGAIGIASVNGRALRFVQKPCRSCEELLFVDHEPVIGSISEEKTIGFIADVIVEKISIC